MKASSLKYLIKEGVRNLWSNRVMAFTSIGVLTTCLLIVGAAFLVTVNVGSMVSYVEGQSEMSVIMKEFDKPKIDVPETSIESEAQGTESQEAQSKEPQAQEPPPEGAPEGGEDTAKLRQEMVAKTQAEIEAIPNIKSCKYVSKEEGLENTKEMLGDSQFLLDGLDDRNYIPDVFTITVNELEKTAQTKAAIEKIEGVEMVLASTEVSDTLTYLQRTINTLGSAIIIALAIISVVIVSNTIRATIFARRKEINIMKFVGATNSFIRIPFVVEGFFLGLISAVVAYLVIWGSYSYLIQAFTINVSEFINAVFESVIPFSDVAVNLAWFFGITGTLLGSVGSVISIRNHARV